MRISKYEMFNINQNHKIVIDEIDEAISLVNIDDHRTKLSKEKTSNGEMFYNPSSMNKNIKDNFIGRNWKDGNIIREKTIFSSNIDDIENFYNSSEIEKESMAGRSYDAPDFYKEYVLHNNMVKFIMEIQFGKYAFHTRDNIYKSKLFFDLKKSDICISICLMKHITDMMSTGIGFYEKSLVEIVNSKISHPLIIIGID